MKEEFKYGYIHVIENGFGYAQELPLALGDNVIGRSNKDTTGIDLPIVTGDPSMGRKHCVIRVKQQHGGEGFTYTLRDFPSLTGTFLRNTCLGKKEQARIEEGDIITIGATTFIFHESL
jgi:pSer/pThr/pTyr-binding forkhead associated (FHA) protein